MLVSVADRELLERHAPILAFNVGEYFLPASIEAFLARCELWQINGPGERSRCATPGELDPTTLVERTTQPGVGHFLRLVSEPLPRSERVAWLLRRDRPRFRAETRLGRVGVLARLVDAFARVLLVVRGSVPAGAAAAAAMLDRDRPEHGDHPYYGRVVRSAGYVVLQYWYFYFFNDWRSRAHGVNDHEGDWEQVTIFLADGGDAEPEPLWVVFSAHDEAGADLRRRWDDPDLTIVDGHPLVNVGLGSHSGAYLAGEYLTTVRRSRVAAVIRFTRRVSRILLPWTPDAHGDDGLGVPYVDYARGDGVTIGYGRPQPWRAEVIDDETPWVRDYLGLWGNDTNDAFGGERGPAGPRYERDGRVRRSWADPVGWAALDAVFPSDVERREVLTSRIVEIDGEIVVRRAEQQHRRRRLRAAVAGGAVLAESDRRELADLASQLWSLEDEQRRLGQVLERPVPPPHPHAHLTHRRLPLPDDPPGRRRVLRIWSTISTPLLLALLGLMVLRVDIVGFGVAQVGLLTVLTLEAMARRRLASFLLVALVVVTAVSVSGLIVAGIMLSWRYTLAALFIGVAAAVLTVNLRELRRT